MQNSFIIGITGTLGAGKGTVVEYLTGRKGFSHYPVRDFLQKELARRGLPVNRDTLTDIANEIRVRHGTAYIVEQLFLQAQQHATSSVIESIRTPGEVDALRKHKDFYLLAVDADPEKRYQRIRKRNSETDNISYQRFLENEQREMHSDDPNKQNLSACINKADYVMENNDTIEDLNQQTESFLAAIGFYSMPNGNNNLLGQ